jgi:hypothetical protein
LLRVERRAFLRARRRSALFVALVALPCAALVAAAALQRTVLPTDEQVRAERFGAHSLVAVGGTSAVLAGFAEALAGDEAHELATLSDGAVVLRFDADDARVEALAAHARRRGLALERRADAAADTSFETLALHVASVFGFAVAALVVGAAVAVGLRRRTLDFARLAACGARAGHIGAALALATAGAGLCAALVGAPLGIGAAYASLPLVEAWTEREHGALVIAWGAVLAAPLLGVFAALAAAGPSIVRVVREVQSLRGVGDRAPRAPSARGAWFGSAVFLCGVAVVFTAHGDQAVDRTSSAARAFASLAGGSLLGLAGLACTAGVCVRAAARLSDRAPLAWRLAVRDAARSSGRSAAAALAVLAGLASATAIASLGAAVLEVARANGDAAAQRDPLLELALLAACVLGLGVVAVATALDAAEGARDTAVLAVNGAQPRTLLALSGARAAHLALVGGVLSVPAGLLPALGLVRAADVPLAFALPWREIVAALVVLPVLAFAVGAAVSALVARRAPTTP